MTETRVKIAPSILSADFTALAADVRRVEEAGADMLHLDVMDGHFVPNISIGPFIVEHVRKITKLPLDVHLMIAQPGRYVDAFVKAGSDMITIHAEAVDAGEFRRLAELVKSCGVGAGVSLNPATPISAITPLLGCVDFVLVMSVNPGFGGQSFMPEVLPKIRELRKVFSGDIAVDGGINAETASRVRLAGANVLVAGSYIFGARDARTAMETIRHA